MDARPLYEEAAVFRCALLGGIVQPAEVVAWADAWIMRMGELPDALIEVSLSGPRWKEMLTALGELGAAELSSEAAARLCSLSLQYLGRHLDGYKTVTRLFEHLAVERSLPEEMIGEVAGLDDALNLAEGGIFFDPAEVRQEIREFLRRYAG